MDEVRISDFPFEAYVPIEGEEFFEGRITLDKLEKSISAQIDIVQIQSKKIYKHIDIMYGSENSSEALQLAVEKLSRFLQNKC